MKGLVDLVIEEDHARVDGGMQTLAAVMVFIAMILGSQDVFSVK